MSDPRQQDWASKETAESFRLAAKDLAEMVMAYDMQRRLLFANSAAQTLTGYSVDELTTAQFICWIHPEDCERMLGYWDQLFQGKSFHEEEYRLITKDGRTKWAEASWAPIVDDDGNQVGVQGRERDITQRKMAEATLRHSEQRLREDEERYRALFESSPFPMWEEDFSEVKRYLDTLAASGVTDIRSHLTAHREALAGCLERVRVLDVNRAAREFYGARDKQELLAGLDKIFDERAFEVFCDEIATLAGNNSVFRAEFPVLTLSGEERTVSMIVSIVEARQHDWSRVIVSFFDITDRKRLEEQFVQAQKMESLGRLAGGIAHDFNNLLTVINGYSELVLQKMDAQDPLRSPLEEIRSAGQQCAELTGQLLAFSRKQVVQAQPLDVNRLIVESRAVLKRVIGDDVEFSVSLDPGLGTVLADHGQIYQVLMNLVVNAREAMPEGGRLVVETRNIELTPQLEERTARPGTAPFILLEVRDSGSGMDERTKRHLFEPFFTTKKNRKSTGLGLATVFGIVTHGGGHIRVISEPGSGTTLKVYLPRIHASATVASVGTAPEPDYTGSGTVLVVEDRAEVRGLVCHMLENLGYRVLAASGGAEALTLSGELAAPIHLLLTDVIMPGMNGRELSERLIPLHPGMKVIFMSGYTGQFISQIKSSAYLQKPFSRSQLIEILRRVMD
jgi:two-component system cell cycle sensor histidine kinase/response regulator CckA